MRLNLNYGSPIRLRVLGILAFSFFLLKGIAWIMVPVFLGSAITSCGSDDTTAEVSHD